MYFTSGMVKPSTSIMKDARHVSRSRKAVFCLVYLEHMAYNKKGDGICILWEEISCTVLLRYLSESTHT